MPSVRCPGCGRSIDLEFHEIGLTFVCAGCETAFSTLTGETVQPEPSEEVQAPSAPPEATAPGPLGSAFYGQRVVDEHVRQIEGTLLVDGEVIRLAITGKVIEMAKHLDPLGRSVSGPVLKGSMFRRHYLVATDQRVILWARGLSVGGATESFRLADLQDVEFRHGGIGNLLILSLPAKQAAFGGMVPKEGRAARDLTERYRPRQ